jgi:MULE transposase domain
MSSVAEPINNENNYDNEGNIAFIGNVLGSEFENCVHLPPITTPIEIEVGTKFYSMPIAVHFVEQHALQKNFAVIRHKNEKFPDGTCRKRVFKCDLGGKYQERLLRPIVGKIKNKGSKKIGCMWQVNINRKLGSSTATVTVFNSEHNHELSAETVAFATAYKNFPEEIFEQIEYYVVNGQCDATTIRNLLQPKYPDRVFLTQDLGNAIQRIKREKKLELGDAASLLTKLLEFQAKDPAWFVRPLLDDTSNRLIGIFWMSPEQRERWYKFHDIIIHDNTARTNKYNYPLSLFILIDNCNKSRLAAQAFMQDERQESYEWVLRCCLEACEIPPLTFVTDADPAMIAATSVVFPEANHMQCLFHIYQNLPKNLRSCLGSSLYQEFLKDFREIQRSYCEDVFERRTQGLVEKYAAGGKYITTMLLNRKHTWVKCYTSRCFTAGTQSTQRVESENTLIQKAVQASFSLFQVQESIEHRLEFETINNRYSIWKASTLQYTKPFVIQAFFGDIDNIMKKYLTQPIHDAHYKQMCQSVCYRACQVPISEALTSDDNSFEPFFDREEDSTNILVEPDEDRELNLQSLIAVVNPDDIVEIWKISRYNHPKSYQHLILLSTGEHFCTCYMLITHGVICRHFFKIFVESSKARFHLTLIPCRWYKDEYIGSNGSFSDEVVIANSNFSHGTLEFVQKYTVNDISERNSRRISINQLRYGVLMGEARKAIQFTIEDGDEELIQFIREFNEKREQVRSESIRRQESTNREVLVDYNQVLDPLRHQSKGRPPMKRLKSSVEYKKSKDKDASDGGRKCGLCGETGHYRNTCSKN